MKTSLRFSTSSERTSCLASNAEVARPAAPAPTIRTGKCLTFFVVSYSYGTNQFRLNSNVARLGWNAQLRNRSAGKRQDHVFEYASHIDPVDRPSRDHPKNVEAQCGVGDQAQVTARRNLPPSHRMV